MEQKKLSELKMQDKPLTDYQFEKIDDNMRIYYLPIVYDDQPDSLGTSGFHFYCVKWAGENVLNPDLYAEIERHKLGKQPNHWIPEHTYAECFFEGVAYYDGIRHLYMGSEETDNYAYHYYPDCDDYIAFFNKLAELEKKFCNEGLMK